MQSPAALQAHCFPMLFLALILHCICMQESSVQQQQPDLPKVRIGNTSSSTSSSDSIGQHPGSPARSPSIKPVYSRAGSMKEATCNDGSNGGSNDNSSGGCSQQGQSVGSMLMSAGHDGRVIQWDLTGGTPVALQSISAAAGAEGGSELTVMAYLQGSSILATGA